MTPLPLGIRVVDDSGKEEFSELIPGNTHIPAQQRNVYTTVKDGQTVADIEIYSGSLDSAARIGQFRLGELAATAGEKPQIEVTFAIDASCVLEVTAQDLGTGRSRSIRVTDTTLLSPAEIDDMSRRRERQADLEELRGQLSELIAEATSDDIQASWDEFRNRLAIYRPSSTPLDESTERAVATMFHDSPDVEVQLSLLRGPLRDLAGKAQEYLNRNAGQDPAQAMAEGQHLTRELREHLDRLRGRLDQLARWNTLLVRLVVAEPDPLLRFRHRHDTGDYAQALAALDELNTPIDEPADLARQLRCLAETGDVHRYRTVLIAHAGALNATMPDPTNLRQYAAALRPALVSVVRQQADGTMVTWRGFLVADDLVATSRRWLTPAGADSMVTADRITVNGLRVRTITSSDQVAVDIALLRLDSAMAGPLRLGHAALVRIGDQVFTPAPGETPTDLLTGLIDGFESFPERGLRLFRTGLLVPAGCAGGPLLNDLGEVIGILTAGEQHSGGAFALPVDAIADLATSAR